MTEVIESGGALRSNAGRIDPGETAQTQAKCPRCHRVAESAAEVGLETRLLDQFAALLDDAEGRASAKNLLATARLGDASEAMTRWGTVVEAAAHLGVSRATLDRMRKEQRDRGWELPGDPVPLGLGTKRRRERWDLDLVGVWAAAFRAKQGERPQRKPGTGRPRRTPKRRKRSEKPGGSDSLFARAAAQVAASGPKD